MIISLSFDDGREDNYRIAFPIMKKYNIRGTLHITTGYIDGTWTPPHGTWKSAKGPVRLEELLEMQNQGFEIAFHGDRHTMQPADYEKGLKKLQSWGLLRNNAVGFSAPNSNIAAKKDFLKIENNRCLYLREGRNPDCYKLRNKASFVLYRLTGIEHFYYSFNKSNCMNLADIDPFCLYAIVIRKEDRADAILKFLKRYVNKNVWFIFMLHSIQEDVEDSGETDAWCWDKREFQRLCSSLSSIAQEGDAAVKPICEVIQTLRTSNVKKEN